MKNISITILALCLFTLSTKAQTSRPDSIFPKGKLTAANFTGNVWVQPLY